MKKTAVTTREKQDWYEMKICNCNVCH